MAFHSTCRNPAYRPDIDGLRAVAVLAVVFYHAGIPAFRRLVGIDIFFVISGFLITGIVWSEIDDKEFSLQNFISGASSEFFPRSSPSDCHVDRRIRLAHPKGPGGIWPIG